MSLKSIGYLVALLFSSAAPALASQISVLPGGSNDGSIVVNAFNFVPPVVATYSGPTVDSKTTSSTSPACCAAGTSTVTGGLTIANSPTPDIFTTAQIDLSGVASANVSVQDITHYSFRIDGAPGQAQVFVNATGNAGFSPGSQWAAASTFAFFRVQAQANGPIIVDDTIQLDSAVGGGFVDESNPGVLAPSSSLGFTVAQNFTFQTNTIYDVTLRAQLGGTANNSVGSLSESMFANIDPMFTVNGPFSIEISPGFGGVTVSPTGPGVPEPATWAMMLLGFGGLGAVLRGRRRAAAA